MLLYIEVIKAKYIIKNGYAIYNDYKQSMVYYTQVGKSFSFITLSFLRTITSFKDSQKLEPSK